MPMLLEDLRAGGWASAVLLAALGVSCGARSTHEPSGGATGGAPAAGSGGESAGNAGVISTWGGRTGGGAGGAAPAGAAGRDANSCDQVALWNAITRGVGALQCDVEDPPLEGDMVPWLHGAVVIDDDGRVIDNTGLNGLASQEKQAWLDALSNQRWVCLAGSTIGYRCRGSLGGP